MPYTPFIKEDGKLLRGRCRDNGPTRCVYGYVEAVSLAVLADT